MDAPSRRSFLRTALTTLAGTAAGRARPGAIQIPLAFQVHAVRSRAASDFPGTLRMIAAFGYTEVELVSFRGYASPAPRDGFGPLAPLPPATVRGIIRDAGLTVRSAHFKYEELEGSRIGDSLAWARGVGLRYVTLSDLPPTPTPGDWTRLFDAFDTLATRVRAEGMDLGLHTSNALWAPLGRSLVMDELLRSVDPQGCRIQLDLSTTQSMGIDPAGFVRQHGSRCFALHLRDAPTPATSGGYVYSVPLGMGDLDLAAVLAAARAAGISQYIVEMQVQPPADPIEALRLSAEYLRALRLD